LTGNTGNTSKADSEYIKDALAIEDEYESELAAVQVALTRFEVAPHEYAARRAEIAARAYLKLAEAHQRFLGRNNLGHMLAVERDRRDTPVAVSTEIYGSR
jgi:hypothetical protein